MKKVLFLTTSLLILSLILVGCNGDFNLTTPSSTVEQGVIYLDRNGEEPCQGNYPLYAGQDNLVGEVIVTDDGGYLCVEYVLDQDVLDAGWRIYETHIAVGADAGEIPQTKPKKNQPYGNPKVGHFPYGDDDLGGVEFYKECGIPIPDVDCGVPFVIAAHAVVKKLGGLEGLDLILPDQVLLAVSCPPAENGYFDVTISGGTVLDGIYEGWCIDVDNEIECPDVGYTANVYSSYEEGLLECLIEYPENLDLVNWIINQNYIGEVSGCEGTYYTMGDIQRAIWELLEDDEPDEDEGEGDWLQCRVDEIITDAMAYGEGFEPSCGEKAAVILAPLPECGIQIIIIMVDVPCEGDETAWAAACAPGSFPFVDKGNWATYFNYTVACPCVGCPSITTKSTNIEELFSPPANVSVGGTENDAKIRVWKEFEGILSENLYYDLDEDRSAKSNGPSTSELYVPADTPVCIYYVHFDNEGSTSRLEQTGQITFGADILGLIISGGNIGDFAGEDFMFDADDSIGNSGTIYPTKSGDDYKRGFDVNWTINTDDAVFNDATVDFTMFVVEAHDSMRVILPLVTVPCE